MKKTTSRFKTNQKSETMFNKEFYPTPKHVIDRMGIDCYGKVCLEPSAGKGDIVKYLKSGGAKDVLACEINEDLRRIVSAHANVIADNFLSVNPDQVSHVQLIVMNPPFSKATTHIKHAWEIAPEGCEIIALCNWETLRNRYSRTRTELAAIVNDYGSKENLGDCFSGAERKTNVEVGLVHLFKPALSESFDWDGFFFTEDSDTGSGEGIMTYNEIRAIVNSYVAAVKCFDRVKEVASELNSYTAVTGFRGGFSCTVSRDEVLEDKAAFAKRLQKHCWKHVFNKMKIEKYVTKGVMEDINSFVESRTQYPFTMRNIYRMIEIIIGTRGDIMKRAIVEAVDNFTKHTHENRYGVEGWKTNEGHLLNNKFIVPYACEETFAEDGYLRLLSYRRSISHLIDLTKALCFLTGTNFDNIPGIPTRDTFFRGTWHQWAFFEFKLYKKGTGHFKFKDPKVWELLNREYAKIKGQVLPEKFSA